MPASESRSHRGRPASAKRGTRAGGGAGAAACGGLAHRGGLSVHAALQTELLMPDSPRQ